MEAEQSFLHLQITHTHVKLNHTFHFQLKSGLPSLSPCRTTPFNCTQLLSSQAWKNRPSPIYHWPWLTLSLLTSSVCLWSRSSGRLRHDAFHSVLQRTSAVLNKKSLSSIVQCPKGKKFQIFPGQWFKKSWFGSYCRADTSPDCQGLSVWPFQVLSSPPTHWRS